MIRQFSLATSSTCITRQGRCLRKIQTQVAQKANEYHWARNRACWAAGNVEANGNIPDQPHKLWEGSEKIPLPETLASEFQRDELVDALRMHCTPESPPEEILRVTRNFLRLIKCADFIEQKDLHDKLRQYAVDMCFLDIKPQDVSLQIEQELKSYEEGVEEFTRLQAQLSKVRKGDNKKLNKIIQNWSQKISQQCQTIQDGNIPTKGSWKLSEKKLMSLIDIQTSPAVAIKELVSLFGKPKDGWRGKDELPQKVATYSTRAIQEIGTQLSNHTRIQSMKSQYLNKSNVKVLNHFPATLWNSMNYNNAEEFDVGRFRHRCTKLEIEEAGPEVFYDITNGAKNMTFEALENWIKRNTNHPFYISAYDQLVADRIKKYTHAGSDVYQDTATRHRIAASLGFDLTSFWPQDTILKLGAIFMDMIYKNCYLRDENNNPVPVFKEITVFTSNKMHYEIEAHPLLIDILSDSEAVKSTGQLDPVHRPMIVPPRKWSNHGSGPYFLYDQPIMRAIDKKSQLDLVKLGQMDKLLRGLNATQETPWKLDHRVIDIMMWWYGEKGGGVAKLPYRDDVPDPERTPEMTSRQYGWLLQKVKKENAERYSLRSDFKLRVEMARYYQDTAALYFPQNFDFRGRIYPIPPHLNHIGSDVCRGMMLFAEKKQLHERGWFWLKVNLANKFGFDKAPNAERAKWTEERIPKILACAADPLRDHWYMQADNPWQALACILEVADAVNSGDPTSWWSGLPVAQDGSCNGLQHYAALTRDEKLAEYVNLKPMNKRGDIYQVVQQHVHKSILDPSKWVVGEIDYSAEAEMMKDHITRKLVKTTVMTSVYGVTPYGARRQIRDVLKEMEQKGELVLPAPDESNGFRDWRKGISALLGQMTYNSIGEVTCPAYLSMVWLRDCARKVASRGHRVTWLTPLNLPCMQHYAKTKQSVVLTKSHSILVEEGYTENIAVGKQVSGIAPNFVHSLDSTHCLMSAEVCKYQKNIEFASVHDSFWSHACDVDTLNEVIRDQFIELHKENLLDLQYRRWKTQYPNIRFPPPPKASDFDLNEVRKSEYFFS